MPDLIDDALKQRILASIASDSLVLLCGAGLSMAAPSSISSAKKVAQLCAESYRRRTGASLDSSLANNIELMAEFFFGTNQLEHVLFKQLIDWSEFVRRPPNKGHFAIADFMAAKVCSLVLSTNLDTMIEAAATNLGEPDCYPVLLENELNLHQPHTTLMKVHGCAQRNRFESLWCKQQLDREPLKTRIPALVRWIQGQIPNRDLLIVGFWTDWAYLNQVLVDAVSSTEPRSVILVDPSTDEELMEKSPKIWSWAHSCTNFKHIQSSGDIFLDELRWRVSFHHIWLAWQKGRDIYTELTGTAAPTDPADLVSGLSSDDLYRLRRDVCGVPANGVVRSHSADDSQALLGAIQLALCAAGAILQSNHFRWNGTALRLLNTPNCLLSKVKKDFALEPPDPSPPDRTICIGAIDDGGAPSDIFGRGRPQTFVRNAAAACWETGERFRNEVFGGVSHES